MYLTVKIKLTSDAIQKNPKEEITEMLNSILVEPDGLEYGFVTPLYDSNGNKVGYAQIDEE